MIYLVILYNKNRKIFTSLFLFLNKLKLTLKSSTLLGSVLQIAPGPRRQSHYETRGFLPDSGSRVKRIVLHFAYRVLWVHTILKLNSAHLFIQHNALMSVTQS
jgi:hypothetical protein